MARTRRAAKPAAETAQQPTRGRPTRANAAEEGDDTIIPANPDETIPSIEQTDITATPARRDTTGLDLADDVFGDLDESFADGEIPRVPGSAETTTSWSNFRPRSRQSSIIGRNDAPIRPSSRASNTGIGSSFTIGAFRRRAREPSILATSRRPRSETSAAPSDLESEGEFAPDAESTPLNKKRRTTRASLAASQANTSVAASSSRTTRKRKSEQPHAANEQPEKASRVDAEDDDSNSESELSEVASPKLARNPFLNARPVTPINDEEIMAPPASSGSEDEGEVWPDIHNLAKRRRRPSVSTPNRIEQMSDMSSPPSLTHSPNFPGGRSGKRRGHQSPVKSPPKITTADLASLLPQRRYKKTSEPHADSSDEEEEEEEEEETNTRSSRRKANSSRASSRARGLKNATSNAKQAATGTRKSKRNARRLSDKENLSDDDIDEHDESAFQPLPEDTFDDGVESSVNVQTAEELKQAVKKFAEVDKWEMEYEEVAESYSPKGAR
ncbi:hypothetical protein VHEMI05151 [[Torrubiella] hemipterigena]|uniref:Uncharacterized protein n=1 Tax=[Torrubiella] hemipterigena TaxID=1531966 RepID=A0A0A1SX79_9HYPO|nr:hypothetical protein VHEMI05151 [[Torrubiella] hemipterigena]